MKKPIPVPAVVGAIAVVLVGVILAFAIGGKGEPEFKKPPLTGKTPDYILDKMSPDQRAKIEDEERKSGVNKQLEQQQQPGQNPYAPK